MPVTGTRRVVPSVMVGCGVVSIVPPAMMRHCVPAGVPAMMMGCGVCSVMAAVSATVAMPASGERRRRDHEQRCRHRCDRRKFAAHGMNSLVLEDDDAANAPHTERQMNAGIKVL
jgi:hypothetical protein